MVRSIPPRTMRDRWREERESKIRRYRKKVITRPEIARPTPSSRSKVYQKPRQWAYVTKPIFKKIKEPLIDVFKEAKEVKIIIDLGSFSRGEIDINMKADKYIIFAKSEGQEFSEEINLPPDVDIENTVEHLKHGILEITLLRKKERRKAKKKVRHKAKKKVKHKARKRKKRG